MSSTTLLFRPRLRSNFHKALRSTESKAAFRSTTAIQGGCLNSFLVQMMVLNEIIRSTPVSEMIYTVSSGTLNSSIPYHSIHRWTSRVNPHQLDGFKSSDGEFYTKSYGVQQLNHRPTHHFHQLPLLFHLQPAFVIWVWGVVWPGLVTHDSC